MHQLAESDLARIAAGAHQECAVGDAEIYTILWRRAGQESVGETRCETVAAADTVFDFQIGIGGAVVKRAIVPHYGRPIVYERRLNAAQCRADGLDVWVILHDAFDHRLKRRGIELA